VATTRQLLKATGSSPTNLQFLEAMFWGAPDGTHTMVTAFSDDPDKGCWGGWPWWPGQPLSKPGFDVENTYVTMSLFNRHSGDGRKYRRKDVFHSQRALQIDDIGTKVPWGSVKLPHSALIETSPGNFQGYLFLTQDAAAKDRGVCERLVDAMIKNGLTANAKDPGMRGVTRFGRLPIGINNKAKYVAKLGQPWTVRCHEFAPARHYTVAQIAQAYGLDLTKTEPNWSPGVITTDMMQVADRRFAALLQAFAHRGMYKNRSRGNPRWHDVICPWIENHSDRADSGSALEEPNEDNRFDGRFTCHHGSCGDKHIIDVEAWWWDSYCARKKQ
jgi:hypothetical protein